MRDSGAWTEQRKLTKDDFQEILEARINSIDFFNAGQDVVTFIKDPDEVTNWSKEFFLTAVKDIRIG